MVSHLDPRGIVIETPAMIADALSASLGRKVSRDISALARMIASETDARHPETAIVRAHIALNDLADLNRRHPSWQWTIEELITYSSMPQHRGHFGEQRWGRRYASTKDATLADVATAEHAIAQHAAGEDPTGGALKFVDRRSMGVQGGSGRYEDLVESWGSEGLRPHTLDGFPDDLVVFRRTRTA